MQQPSRGIKHNAHRHFRIVSGGEAAAKRDKAPNPEEGAVDNHRSPLADEAKSSLSLQGRERSQLRNELTTLISVLCTEGLYAMVACRSDLRHIVPATLRADSEMTQISCCFSDESSAWVIPIPTIEEIITGAALNTEFPLTLTENLLAKTCAIRSSQLEDIIIMCETPVDKRQLVSALSLFIMLPNKLSARAPLIETSPENGGTEWAPSPSRTSDGEDRIIIDQSPIGAFAETGPEPKSMLSVIPESGGSTEKAARRRKHRSTSRKDRKSRRDPAPSQPAKKSERRRADENISLPIPARAASQAPPVRKPQGSRGREPSNRMPVHGTVHTVEARAASHNPRSSSHRARPMSTRSPSPYLRAQRREYNIPPMPGVYSLDNSAGNWNGPRAARPPRLAESRAFPFPELTCCNFCEHREESVLDRMTLRRVMAPVPGIGQEIDTWRNSPNGSAVSDGKRNVAGRSIPSTRMTPSQLDITDTLPSPRHFDPPVARFGRVMPETNKVSEIVGYKSPVSYIPRSASPSPPRQISSNYNAWSQETQHVVSHGVVLPKRSSSPPIRKAVVTTHVPVTTELMSFTTDSDESQADTSLSTSTSQALFPRPSFAPARDTERKPAARHVPSDPTLKLSHVGLSARKVPSAATPTEDPPSPSPPLEIPADVTTASQTLKSSGSPKLSAHTRKATDRESLMAPGTEIKARGIVETEQAERIPEIKLLAEPSEHNKERLLLEDEKLAREIEGVPGVKSLHVETQAAGEGEEDLRPADTAEGLALDLEKVPHLNPKGVSARTDGRSKATGFTAFFDRELSESTWQPDITDRENTLTLLYAKQLDAKPHQRPSAPVSAVREEEETFSISASQIVPRPITIGNSSTSNLREGSIWRSDLGHKQMTPLEKLKTANLGFPTPFTAAVAKRQESSEANMMLKWSRSKL